VQAVFLAARHFATDTCCSAGLDIVVAAPAKDMLQVTGSQNRKSPAAVRKLVTGFVGEERYRITGALFVYRDGRFTRFGRKWRSRYLLRASRSHILISLSRCGALAATFCPSCRRIR
jgi:hypothetical protein